MPKNKLSTSATAHHGTREKKHHSTACRKAARTASCVAGESWSRAVTSDSAPASAGRSEAGILPASTAALMPDLTLAFKTAPHWARPTVPPNPGPSAAAFMADAALGEPVFDAPPEVAALVMEPIADESWDANEEPMDERAEDALGPSPLVMVPTALVAVQNGVGVSGVRSCA